MCRLETSMCGYASMWSVGTCFVGHGCLHACKVTFCKTWNKISLSDRERLTETFCIILYKDTFSLINSNLRNGKVGTQPPKDIQQSFFLEIRLLNNINLLFTLIYRYVVEVIHWEKIFYSHLICNIHYYNWDLLVWFLKIFLSYYQIIFCYLWEKADQTVSRETRGSRTDCIWNVKIQIKKTVVTEI